jgi:hypothetical protein
MEHGEKDLAHLLKEFAPVNGSMSGGLTDAKTKFYWEEMLEAVQVAHQVIIIPIDRSDNDTLQYNKSQILTF